MKSLALVCFLILGVNSQEDDHGYTKLWVMNGEPLDESQMIEVFDLENPGTPCFSPAPFPAAKAGTVAAYIDGRVLACGGFTDTATTRRCHEYDAANDEWVEREDLLLSRRRDEAGSIVVAEEGVDGSNETVWWISGGYESGSGKLTSTETYRTGLGFDRSPIDLPLGMDLHNIHRLNSTHYFLIGGYSSLLDDGHPYFLDYTTGEFTPADNMLTPRHGVFSGLVIAPDGAQVIVIAGGYTDTYESSAEAFDVAPASWRLASRFDFPYGLAFGASVPYRDGMLAVGGYRLNSDGFGESDKIFQFRAATMRWDELPMRLTVPRDELTAFLVPDDLVEC